jgi:hypothetical protein
MVACRPGGCRSLVDNMDPDGLTQSRDGRYLHSRFQEIQRHTNDRAQVFVLAPDREPIIRKVPGQPAGRVRLRLGPATQGQPRPYPSDDSA